MLLQVQSLFQSLVSTLWPVEIPAVQVEASHRWNVVQRGMQVMHDLLLESLVTDNVIEDVIALFEKQDTCLLPLLGRVEDQAARAAILLWFLEEYRIVGDLLVIDIEDHFDHGHAVILRGILEEIDLI